MSVVGSLIAYGLRQVIGDAAVDSGGQALSAVKSYFTDHSKTLPAALARANDRAWQAVGLALAGDGFFDRVKDLFRDGDLKGVRDQIKRFLADTPTGLESSAAELRAKAAADWNRLRKAGRLSADAVLSEELAGRTAALERYGDPSRLTAAAHRAVAETAASLKAEAPHLSGLLTAAPPDGAPLLAVAFAFFFRREVETNEELARGLSFDSLRRIGERQERGFRELEQSLGAVGDLFAVIDAKLDDINAKLDWLIHRCDVPTSTSDPLKVSVTNKAELDLLESLRDRLRALPPEVVAAADWSKLGDVLAAAGQFREAAEAQEAAARAAADRAAEAEAEYKRFRGACEAGDRDAAMTAFRRAVELDPERFAPFDLHRYRPVAVLGAGGFGTVFLAHDLYSRSQKVAIKAVHDSGWDAILERDLAETFDEANTLSALNYPGIVKTLNRGFGDPARLKRPFLVMEYFEGVTLEAWLKTKGTLPVQDVLVIARQIAEAVHAAHQVGVFHRDVKPANVMARFDEATGQWRVKVIDFGLAVKVQVARTSMGVPSGSRAALDRSLAGTWRYAPPEQRNDLDADVGPYSDVYAWGKTCLDLLLGTTEPKSFDWEAVPESHRKQTQHLLERATVDNLKRRWPDFGPVLAALAALPPARPKAGDVYTLRIVAPDGEHVPGEIMSVKIPTVDRGPKPGTLTALKWKRVPSRPNPNR